MNVSAIEEHKEVKARYDELSRQVTDVGGEPQRAGTHDRKKLSPRCGRDLSPTASAPSTKTSAACSPSCLVAAKLSLVLEDEKRCWPAALAPGTPPGKVIKNLEALSGGEQALVAISIYFAILAVNPRPSAFWTRSKPRWTIPTWCDLPSICAASATKTQFIVITHRRGTMEAANVLYGVTMQEDGVSKLLKLDLEQVDATLVS